MKDNSHPTSFSIMPFIEMLFIVASIILKIFFYFFLFFPIFCVPFKSFHYHFVVFTEQDKKKVNRRKTKIFTKNLKKDEKREGKRNEIASKWFSRSKRKRRSRWENFPANRCGKWGSWEEGGTSHEFQMMKERSQRKIMNGIWFSFYFQP